MFKSILVFLACASLAITNCHAQVQADPPTDGVVAQKLTAGTGAEIDFEKKILPLLERYCIDCHATGNMEGLDFLAVENGAEVANHRNLYAGVFLAMKEGSMPPKDFDQPSDRELELVTDWIEQTLELKPKDTDRIAQYVVEAYEDREGNRWFGTMHKGAVRYDGKGLSYFSEKDGLPSNTVTSFAEDADGNLWVGTHQGVAKFRDNAFIRAEGLVGLGGSSPTAWAGVKADRERNIWVSMGMRLFRQDGKSFKEFKLPIAEEEISSFAILAGDVSLQLQDKAGNFWLGTDGSGAYKFDGKSFTHFTQRDGLCSNNITSILEDKQGRIWFTCIQSYQPKMTGDGGVCRYDGTSFTRFPQVKGLSNNDIYTIHETRSGDIWIGATGVGAYRYDGDSFKLFGETNRSMWTRNFGVQSILEDRDGTLWFGFSGGLFRFNGQSFFNVTKEGPWMGMYSAMAIAANGGEVEPEVLPEETTAGMSILAKRQFDRAKDLLLKLQLDDPDEPTIQEFAVNQVGYRLVFSDRLDLAIDVFKLNTHLYPHVANTYDSLAEAYLRNGDEQLALENYETSLELNPKNTAAKIEIDKIAARRNYEKVLVAPDNWLEEVLIVPTSFAPTMSLRGVEHLRLPPEFRDPDSEWFLSYLFAIELMEPAELNGKMIGEQLLIYFRGLASGGSDQDGNKIDTDTFSIEAQNGNRGQTGEYLYTLNWQEPFANATPLKQNIRVKVINGKNKHGVVFICGSPQQYESAVWTELLKIREAFESAAVPSESNPAEIKRSDEYLPPTTEHRKTIE